MLTMKQRSPAIRTHRRWAIGILQEVGAVRECEDHGWMRDRADPHARDHAIDIARHVPPAALSPDAAEVEDAGFARHQGRMFSETHQRPLP